jgi:hypothetical protein
MTFINPLPQEVTKQTVVTIGNTMNAVAPELASPTEKEIPRRLGRTTISPADRAEGMRVVSATINIEKSGTGFYRFLASPLKCIRIITHRR